MVIYLEIDAHGFAHAVLTHGRHASRRVLHAQPWLVDHYHGDTRKATVAEQTALEAALHAEVTRLFAAGERCALDPL